MIWPARTAGFAQPGDKDEVLALALAEGCTRVEAARRADMGLRTVFTRLKDPAFVALVRTLRDRIVSQAVGVLAASSVEAANTLRVLVKDKDPTVSLAACKAILTNVVRVGTYDELAGRIAALEESARARGDAMRGLAARVERLERIAGSTIPDPRTPETFDWYGTACPCGLPPGECREHPRARPAQRPPESDWRTWLVLAGRGFGKTRTGVEWVRDLVAGGTARRVALVGATAADVRDVLVEGESGILACSPPWDRPLYEPSKRRLTWPNGAIATCYSADEPERLRGPQHDAALADEVASWRRPAAWDNLAMGLRLGTKPRTCVCTTPKPTTLLKRIIGASSTARTGGNTFDNRMHLAADFIAEITSRYEGTRLGRQEIHAELLDVVDGQWFVAFDPARHVTLEAGYTPGIPVRVAIDCGVSRHTGAVFYQVFEIDKFRSIINVFGDYYREGDFSETNALAIRELLSKLAPGVEPERVRLDPAASARTGVGPAAFGEYKRVFGRQVSYWPPHLVADGLDQIELLLGPLSRPPDLVIHPRCEHLIAAFNGYSRATQGGEFLNHPLDPQHPHEDLMDSLRGGIRDAFPEGRTPKFKGTRMSVSGLVV